jgi:hypothetical protein
MTCAPVGGQAMKLVDLYLLLPKEVDYKTSAGVIFFCKEKEEDC